MLGSYRLILAMMVMGFHLTQGGNVPVLHLGVFAVFGFYVVSGYLMTLILHEIYRFDFRAYVLNRFLRIYPPYIFVFVLSLPIILFYEDVSVHHSAWKTFSAPDFLSGLTLVPLAFYKANFRVLPSSWSIAVEVVCYLLLYLFTARNRRFCYVTIFLAGLYHLWSFMSGESWVERYTPVIAALLPFSFGAVIYFHPIRMKDHYLYVWVIGWMTLWVANIVLVSLLNWQSAAIFDMHYYINLMFTVLMVAGIVALPRGLFYQDKTWGDLAYPVFLLHWPIGYLVGHYVFGHRYRGGDVFLAALPCTLLLAYGLAKISNIYIEPRRSLIRKNIKY